MSLASAPPSPRRRRNPHLWLLGLAGVTYLGSFFITFLVTVAAPAVSWARAFKIIGLSFNVAGAIISLTPRAIRDMEMIERELSMIDGRDRLRRDTLTARYGLAVIAIGFIQQLFGNLLG